jgi:hypothetical protein
MKFRSDHIENKSKLIQVKNPLIFQKGASLWNVRHGQGRESWKQPEAVFLVTTINDSFCNESICIYFWVVMSPAVT